MAPFEVFALYTVKVLELALRKDMSNQEVLDEMIATYRRGVKVLPGAREAVALLGARYPLAVASSSPRELIPIALERAGLAGSFSVLTSSDEQRDLVDGPIYRVELQYDFVGVLEYGRDMGGRASGRFQRRRQIRYHRPRPAKWTMVDRDLQRKYRV